MLNRLADRVRLRTQHDGSGMHREPPAAPAARSREFVPGEVVSGSVESVQPDGIVKVLIEHRPYLLRLPVEVKAGYTLQLTVSAIEPALRFTLNEKPATPDADTHLSDAARFITALLAESEKLPLARASASGTPLLSQTPPSSTIMAHALQRALSESGMFYEAHQAQWVAGERPLALLMKEPQARLPLHGPAALEGAETGSVADTPPATELPVHRDALPIVRQQLETLDSRQILWTGQIWAGQPLEWRVSRSPIRTPDDDPVWQAHLVLDLPRLGLLAATLLLRSSGVSISIKPTSADTVTELTAHRKDLVQALRGSGILPVTVSIDLDEIH